MKSSMDKKKISQLDPFVPKKKKATPYLFVRLPEELKSELEKAAKQESRSRGKRVTTNKLVLHYIVEGLKKAA